MITEAPKFTRSKFFVNEPEWHLKEGASEEDKEELELFMNPVGGLNRWESDHPEMKNPYYTWSGKVVDRG